MKDIFSITLKLLSTYMTIALEPGAKSEIKRVLLTGMLAECPYCVRFLRDHVETLPPNVVLLSNRRRASLHLSFNCEDMFS